MSDSESILDQIAEAPADHYRVLKISDLDGGKLLELSQFMHLSLSEEDMLAVQEIYKDWDREPTDVELEVIAQTWSEHCKHRIFGADIDHEVNGEMEKVKSLFKTYIYDVSQRIFDSKPGFVLSAFHDNAGFIKLDDNLAVCLKAETHNHPSAIEPYAGANARAGRGHGRPAEREDLGRAELRADRDDAGAEHRRSSELDARLKSLPDARRREVVGHGAQHERARDAADVQALGHLCGHRYAAGGRRYCRAEARAAFCEGGEHCLFYAAQVALR